MQRKTVIKRKFIKDETWLGVKYPHLLFRNYKRWISKRKKIELEMRRRRRKEKPEFEQ